MSASESTTRHGTERRSSRLRSLVIAQLGLLLLTVIVFSYIGWRVKPLLQTQQQLERDIKDKNEQLQALNERLQGLKEQIETRENVLRQLNSAITSSKDEALVREAGQIQIQTLKGYKLGIYFLQGNNAERRATDLMSSLRKGQYPSEIELYPKPMSFFDLYGRPDKDELRYEVDYEDAQAQTLSALLRRVDPTHEYELTKVENRTPRFLSIFIDVGFK